MSFNKWMEYFNFLKIFNIKHWILWCNIYNIGGVMYSIGSILYFLGSKRKYFHSIFHFFCILGTLFHYIAIYFYLLV